MALLHSKPAISFYMNIMWHHMGIPMAKRTLFLVKLHTLLRRQTTLAIVGRDLIKLYGHLRNSLKNKKIAPLATHTCQVKIRCHISQPYWSLNAHSYHGQTCCNPNGSLLNPERQACLQRLLLEVRAVAQTARYTQVFSPHAFNITTRFSHCFCVPYSISREIVSYPRMHVNHLLEIWLFNFDRPMVCSYIDGSPQRLLGYKSQSVYLKSQPFRREHLWLRS